MKWFSKILFHLIGWKIINNKSYKLVKKGIFVVAPHNKGASDFITGLLLREVMEVKIMYFGKSELFKGPFGFIFKALGGIPVERSKTQNKVENYITYLKTLDNGFFAIAPEGTRKNVEKLKTGFYYIAEGAAVPILMVGFDFPKKEIVFSDPIYVTGDFESDMQTFLVPFFDRVGGYKKDWVGNYKNGIFDF